MTLRNYVLVVIVLLRVTFEQLGAFTSVQDPRLHMSSPPTTGDDVLGHATRETDITTCISVAHEVRPIPLPRKEDRTAEPLGDVRPRDTAEPPTGVETRPPRRGSPAGVGGASDQKVSRGA